MIGVRPTAGRISEKRSARTPMRWLCHRAGNRTTRSSFRPCWRSTRGATVRDVRRRTWSRQYLRRLPSSAFPSLLRPCAALADILRILGLSGTIFIAVRRQSKKFQLPTHASAKSSGSRLAALNTRNVRCRSGGKGQLLKVWASQARRVGKELSPNLGDGLRDQAAAVWDCEDAGLTATSIPSVNLTP